jgi:hypothetical protein
VITPSVPCQGAFFIPAAATLVALEDKLVRLSADEIAYAAYSVIRAESFVTAYKAVRPSTYLPELYLRSSQEPYPSARRRVYIRKEPAIGGARAVVGVNGVQYNTIRVLVSVLDPVPSRSGSVPVGG